MTDDLDNIVEFDELVAVALAELAAGPAPPPGVKARLMSQIAGDSALPAGFSIRLSRDNAGGPHPVPGLRLQELAVHTRSGSATLRLDVQPGTRFPSHHHDGDEECYVVSGSVITLGRRLGPGDFVHADAGTDHGELRTDEGAMVLLVVPPEDYMPRP